MPVSESLLHLGDFYYSPCLIAYMYATDTKLAKPTALYDMVIMLQTFGNKASQHFSNTLLQPP